MASLCALLVPVIMISRDQLFAQLRTFVGGGRPVSAGVMGDEGQFIQPETTVPQARITVDGQDIDAESGFAPADDYRYDETDNDETLAAQAQAGDHDAFDQLYTRHYSYSWKIAYKMVFHRQDADDLAQAAWVKIYTGLHSFNPDERFLPWLHGITVHAVIDHRRRQQRRPEKLVEDVDLFMGLPSTNVSESVADIVANEDIVRRALSRLRPDLYREVLVLADMIDIRPADIAKRLGLKVSQVDGVLYRARKKFHTLVTSELED
jgi:RNA polymerase sigma-70 factor (ECF subfamily)